MLQARVRAMEARDLVSFLVLLTMGNKNNNNLPRMQLLNDRCDSKGQLQVVLQENAFCSPGSDASLVK